MAHTVAEFVKETSETTGTGTMTLDGAADGFQTFVAGIGNGNTTDYAIFDGTDWEVGIGTVTDAASDTLSRDTVIASSNSGSKVNWGAGTKTVICAWTAYRHNRPVIEFNSQSDSYQLVLADAGKIVYMTKATANNLTVPQNSTVAFPVGTQVHVIQAGAGQVTIVEDTSVTVNTSETLLLRDQWSMVTLIKQATNTWIVVGRLQEL